MAVEIERKFLVIGDTWRGQSEGVPYRQGYMHIGERCTVRIRTKGDQAELTIKGATAGMSRDEYEWDASLDDANAMLDHLCIRPLIEKTRHTVEHQGYEWDIDEFHGDNAGLIVAEVELASEDDDPPIPDWVGEEVTGDPKYYNASLVKKPFKDW